jgi:hypothetical protein
MTPECLFRQNEAVRRREITAIMTKGATGNAHYGGFSLPIGAGQSGSGQDGARPARTGGMGQARPLRSHPKAEARRAGEPARRSISARDRRRRARPTRVSRRADWYAGDGPVPGQVIEEMKLDRIAAATDRDNP